jgi:hypothetical protein
VVFVVAAARNEYPEERSQARAVEGLGSLLKRKQVILSTSETILGATLSQA